MSVKRFRSISRVRPNNSNRPPPRWRRAHGAAMLLIGWGYLVFLIWCAVRLFLT
jgi:hypothetical protein